MIYAIMSTIELDTPAKRDSLATGISNRIVGKPLWVGQLNQLVKTVGATDKPAIRLDMRFPVLADRDDLANFLKQQRGLLPFVSGKIKIHDCYHDEDVKTCLNWQEI